MSAQPGGETMPKGIGNYYLFQVCNMLAMGTAGGATMLLFFKELGATETILGIVGALPMLLFTLQIPAAKHVERVGYRRFVCSGWAARPVCVALMAIVAFLPLNNSVRIGLMLFAILCLSTARGIGTAGMMPWMCELIPESLRGHFVARDLMCVALAGIGCSLMNAFLFSQISSKWSFGLLFIGGTAISMISLNFLRRIPDVPVPHAVRNANPTPWRAIIVYPPFLKLVIFSVFLYLALGASGVFWVPFYRESLHLSKSTILIMGAVESASIAIASWIFGRVVDHIGSKPVLCLACVLYALAFAGLAAMAAGVYPALIPLIIIQQVLSGTSGALFTVACNRLAMSVVPTFGRSHFFAFFMVANCITAAVVPIAWGGILDALRNWHAMTGGWEWNKYTFLYTVLFGIVLAGQLVVRIVDEPKAAKAGEIMRRLFGPRA